MTIHYRFALSLCGTMLIALAAGGTTAQAANSLEIVIANGPHAGTYKLPTAHIVCMNIKSRNHFSAAYKTPPPGMLSRSAGPGSTCLILATPAHDEAKSTSASVIPTRNDLLPTRPPFPTTATV